MKGTYCIKGWEWGVGREEQGKDEEIDENAQSLFMSRMEIRTEGSCR